MKYQTVTAVSIAYYAPVLISALSAMKLSNQSSSHISVAALLALVAFVASCATVAPPRPPSACTVAPPKKTLLDVDKINSAKISLERSLLNGEFSSANVFKSKVEETYQELEDKDVACSMLLRTVACLADKPNNKYTVQTFTNYLADTRACQNTAIPLISVDGIVQTSVDEIILYQYAMQFDVFVRNSGDVPAHITKLSARFDEHLRADRVPDSIQRVSEVYTVAVDQYGADVTGAAIDAPATAYYPNPGSPVFIVSTPIAQVLEPRSSDRFRVKIVFLEGAELRGPFDQMTIAIEFGAEGQYKSDPIEIL